MLEYKSKIRRTEGSVLMLLMCVNYNVLHSLFKLSSSSSSSSSSNNGRSGSSQCKQLVDRR